MNYWVYKCNAKSPDYASTWGDWRQHVFDRPGSVRWGTTSLRGVEQIEKGDTLIAYQTDRNELVGLVDVMELQPLKDGRRRLIVKRGELIGAKVRPLKVRYPHLATIPAFQGGVIRTAYEISHTHARQLLAAARTEVWTPAPRQPMSKTERDEIVRVFAELPPTERRVYERLLRVVARSARLRKKVLQVWPACCAACGLELRDLDDNAECEIAHVRDVHAEGHDLIANAIPLCRTHHWAFDRHLWAIHPKTMKIVVADSAAKYLAAIAGRTIERPAHVGQVEPLAAKHLMWRWKRWQSYSEK